MDIQQLKNCCEFAYGALDGAYGGLTEAVSIILLVVVFNFFIKWFLKKLHLRFERQNKIWKDCFVQALYIPLSYYIWFFAAVHVVNMISEQLMSRQLLPEMHTLMDVALALCFAWFLMRWKKNVVSYMVIKGNRQEIAMDRGKIDVIDKVLTMLIIFGSFLLVLEITDRSMNTLIAFGGVGGLAIAFASQEVISNFFGGLMIYITHPFTIGDWINLPEHNIEGHVEEIGWYMTLIRTFEKRPIYIPNSMFSKVVVMTPSRMSHRQFKELVGLRYSDMPVVKQVIQDIRQMITLHPKIDHNLNNLVNLTSFGNYSVDIQISVYFMTIGAKDYAEVKEDLLFKIYDIVRKHGADLAYPTTQIEWTAKNPFELKKSFEV